MKKKKDSNKDYIIEDLIKSTDKIIEDIPLDNLKPDKPSQKTKKIESEVQKKAIESLELEARAETDGFIKIRILNNDMEVRGSFFPPKGKGNPLSVEDVRDKLKSSGIIFGIDWMTIKENIDKCNSELVQIKDVVISQGKHPTDEVSEQFVVEERLQIKPEISTDKKNQIDYREITSYSLVSKGDTLARVVPKKEGVPGKTVKGELIHYQKAAFAQKKLGKNTKLDGDRIVATTNGRFELWKDIFRVHEIFTVSGDVDYHTGNIQFPGDVVIHGRVSDGFKVKAEGSIVCMETLDASEVRCERNLEVHKGIIGRKKGKISVGGTIRAKYIENCYVEADDSIFIETGILHSVVRTQNRLELPHKSVIAGGKIYAQNGITAGNIGTKMGIKTEIYCGIDHKIQQNLEWINDKSIALSSKLSQIEERLKFKETADERLSKSKEKIEEYITKLNNATKSLVLQLDKNKKADVMIHGTVYPGVYIEISHIPFKVPHEMKDIRFFLVQQDHKVDYEIM